MTDHVDALETGFAILVVVVLVVVIGGFGVLTLYNGATWAVDNPALAGRYTGYAIITIVVCSVIAFILGHAASNTDDWLGR